MLKGRGPVFEGCGLVLEGRGLRRGRGQDLGEGGVRLQLLVQKLT